MPPRLDAGGQKQIDDAWNQALTPLNNYDNQALLDLLVTTQAYQIGVDSLTFRSEKTVLIGKVVMEIAFDRAKPLEDRFTVTVSDKAGKVLRTERYGREQVEVTFATLNRTVAELRQKKDAGAATPAELAELKTIEDRLARVEAVIPKGPPTEVKAK
jgi:hypothetical protein